jgi:hypothetical protein
MIAVNPSDVLLCHGTEWNGGEFLRTVERTTATTCTDTRGTTWNLRSRKARGLNARFDSIATPEDIARVTEAAHLRALRRRCSGAMDRFQNCDRPISRERLEALLAALESALEPTS